MAIHLPLFHATAKRSNLNRSFGEGGKMEMASSGKRVLCKGMEIEGPDNEQKIWASVLLQAVEDWRSDNAKLHRDAEQFLFNEKNDFDIVCAGAGIEPSSFRSRLTRGLQRIADVVATSAEIAA